MGSQTAIVALGAIIVQVALNGLGPIPVAAYSAAQKVDMIFTMPIISFGMAMAAYTAQNYGAHAVERIKTGVRKCALMSGAYSIFAGVINLMFGDKMMELFVGAEERQVIEMGIDEATGKVLVDVNPQFYRPAEVEFLWGDCTKAETELGWKRNIDFNGLVAMMMDADMKAICNKSCEEYKSGK